MTTPTVFALSHRHIGICFYFISYNKPIILLSDGSPMQQLKKFLFSIVIFLFFICLFLFPHASIVGAKNGLLLWFHTLLPTLLPCMILSQFLLQTRICDLICFLLDPICSFFFHTSRYSAYAIFVGCLSGMPNGAKITATLVNEHKISKKEGDLLICLCNQSSFMFLTNYITVSLLSSAVSVFSVSLLFYGALFCNIFLLQKIGFFASFETTNPISYASSSTLSNHPDSQDLFYKLDTCILDGFEIITKIGGYILLFSILSEFVLEQKQIFCPPWKHWILSALEITTGTNYIATGSFPFPYKFLFLLCITAFGGLCGFAQTCSVLSGTPLSKKKYFLAKVSQTILTFCFGLCYLSISN